MERTPTADERHSDLTFAINDAFKRARRRLQDQARRLQGQVKQHEGQPIGTVARLDPSGEFGFLRSGDGREIYFHRNSVLDADFSRLVPGTRVTFAEEVGEKERRRAPSSCLESTSCAHDRLRRASRTPRMGAFSA